jgi:hypothetical protein
MLLSATLYIRDFTWSGMLGYVCGRRYIRTNKAYVYSWAWNWGFVQVLSTFEHLMLVLFRRSTVAPRCWVREVQRERAGILQDIVFWCSVGSTNWGFHQQPTGVLWAGQGLVRQWPVHLYLVWVQLNSFSHLIYYFLNIFSLICSFFSFILVMFGSFLQTLRMFYKSPYCKHKCASTAQINFFYWALSRNRLFLFSLISLTGLAPGRCAGWPCPRPRMSLFSFLISTFLPEAIFIRALCHKTCVWSK